MYMWTENCQRNPFIIEKQTNAVKSVGRLLS